MWGTRAFFEGTERVSKQDCVEFDGVVVKLPGGGLYEVKTEKGHIVLCNLNGKMKQHKITVVVGDTVKIAVSPYDLTRGRIVFRDRNR